MKNGWTQADYNHCAEQIRQEEDERVLKEIYKHIDEELEIQSIYEVNGTLSDLLLTC